MSLSVHDVSVTPLVRGLGNLSGIIKKGAAFAEAKGMDPADLLQARLAPDMFPLIRQVQVVSDVAKGGAARLAGVEVPSWPDDEAGFDALQARVAKATAFVGGIAPERFDGADDRIVTVPMRGTEMKFPGLMFLSGFVLPNFYFHLTTAYAILRHQGVELGKGDYLGGA